MKSKHGWAGICNGKIHITKEADSGYKIYAIFPSRRLARLAYEGVLKINLVTPRKGARNE